jgi:hypothetical protein
MRVCVPQLPHACDDGPLHVWLAHGDHWQLPPHDCVPPFPQGCVVLTEHTPSPVQVDQADHAPVLLSQVRVCVPQLPHACDDGPLHVWLPHTVHRQSPPHDCAPPFPQLWVLPGAQSPSPVHADHIDQTPWSHVRVCVPQLPHPSLAAPVQSEASPPEPVDVASARPSPLSVESALESPCGGEVTGESLPGSGGGAPSTVEAPPSP